MKHWIWEENQSIKREEKKYYNKIRKSKNLEKNMYQNLNLSFFI